jgi:Reverse transcriptase (RNA-dependent DNA polymerase)
MGASAEVLSMITEGVKPVLESTCERYDMGSLRLTGDELEAWIELERQYLAIGAIAEDEDLWCINSCFLFPKSSGGFRLIVDNRPFNQHNVQYPTELDTLHTLSTVLRPMDFLSAFDLQDGYFHLAIHPDYQKYFGFRVNGKGYRMVGLPFGWSGSPQSFMKLTRSIGSMLHTTPSFEWLGKRYSSSNPIRHRILIDDFLLMFESMRAAAPGVEYTRALLSYLGMGVNEAKSSWTPEHVKHHLGLTIDTQKGEFYIPTDKIQRIRNCAKLLLSESSSNARWVPARTVARLCGLVMCISLAFKGAHFFTRCLYDALKAKSSWNGKVKLANSAMSHLKFFSRLHNLWSGRKIWAEKVTCALHVDASDLGWAARAENGSEAHGHWGARVKAMHIMVRECYAVYHGLRSFLLQYRDQVVDVVCDNCAVVFGLAKFTSRSYDLMRVINLIFWLCHRNNIVLVPRLIPSEANVVDSLSRKDLDGEWSLRRWLFDWIQGLYGPHEVDRFASHACHLLPRYNSLFWDPLTEGVDAFQHSWAGVNNFVHPPFHLIRHVVKKLAACRPVRCTLVVPDWPSQPWYLPLMMMSRRVHVVPAGVQMFHAVGDPKALMRSRWSTLVIRVEFNRRDNRCVAGGKSG